MQCFKIMIIGNYVEMVEACKSVYKFAYNVSEFGRTRNY